MQRPWGFFIVFMALTINTSFRRAAPGCPDKGRHACFIEVVVMAREFAKAFYSSKAWQDCRNRYAAKQGHLCENCLRKGVYRPGEIVHHKIEIDPVTVNNPEVSLNPDNLELLCRDCHAERHKSYSKGRRFTIAEDGRVYAT